MKGRARERSRKLYSSAGSFPNSQKDRAGQVEARTLKLHLDSAMWGAGVKPWGSICLLTHCGRNLG